MSEQTRKYPLAGTAPYPPAEDEEGKIVQAFRFDPGTYWEWIRSIRQPYTILSYAEERLGTRLDEWSRQLLISLWEAIVPSLLPIMEVYPIATRSAFFSTFISEVKMVSINLRSLVEQKNQACFKLYQELPEIMKNPEVSSKIQNELKICRALAMHGVDLVSTISLFIINTISRKTQASLPARYLPNSLKAHLGLITD